MSFSYGRRSDVNKIERYINSLNTDNDGFKYSPSRNNLTEYGELLELGFRPKKNVEMAIEEIIDAYRKNELYDGHKSNTVKTLRDMKVS